MSAENRDWMREEPRGSLPFDVLSPKWVILGVTSIAFFVQMAAQNAALEGEPAFLDHLRLSVDGLRAGELWQAVTYGLLHRDLGHVFWNMVGFFLFASVAEDLLSPARILLLYLLGLAGGAAGHVLWCAAGLEGASTFVIGASGAVTAVLVYVAFRVPRKRFHILTLPVPLYGIAVVFVGWDVLAALLQAAGAVVDPADRVAVQAHIGGAVAGAVYGALRRRRPARAEEVPARIRAVALRDPGLDAAPVRPRVEESAEEERMDALLERIHVAGIGSLNAEEREFLNRVSRRYRGRRR